MTTCVPEALCQAQCANYLEGIGGWIRFPDTIHEGLCHMTECIGRFPKLIFLSILPHSQEQWERSEDVERGELGALSQVCQVKPKDPDKEKKFSNLFVCRRLREKKASLADSKSNLRDVARRSVSTD